MYFHSSYLHNGEDHPFLNTFKLCALTGLNVNYTNAGTYASYEGGTPVNIRMNMTFKELNPIYNEDYNDMSDEEASRILMGYFRELPDIAYQSPLLHKNSSKDVMHYKNIFRRSKLLDYLKDNVSVFNKFIIGDGDRPDTIAESLYGDSSLDYVVVLIAGITNINNEGHYKITKCMNILQNTGLMR